MVPRIAGQFITIREPRRSDVPERLRLGRDPDLVRALGGDTRLLRPLTNEELEAWYQDRAMQRYGWSIEYQTRFIGEIRLHSVEPHDRRANLAIAIYDRGCLGRGLGTEAIRLVASYAFNDLTLHRLAARVLASNSRCIRALKKCGFVEEGRERESALVGGQWEDDVVLGLVSLAP